MDTLPKASPGITPENKQMTNQTRKTSVLAPLSAAIRGKGASALFKRTRLIAAHYGWTASKMELALGQFVQVLRQYGCGATFPVTTMALIRHPNIFREYQSQGIEFAVHGLTHIDYSQLAPEEQLNHLRKARQIFEEAGITATGFRSPYLSRNTQLQSAIATAGFSYSSNQPILWDVLEADTITPTTQASYERAITFYRPWPAGQRLSMPRLSNSLVEIPVSLPDDEILLDRLGGITNDLVEKTWRSILSQTHQQGELFTLQLHPERTARCADGLAALLSEARTLTPAVWIARLDEISAWWQARAGTTVKIVAAKGGLHLSVAGPSGVTILARGVQIDAPTTIWHNDYFLVQATSFSLHTPVPFRPFIGVSPTTAPQLRELLRQQGYIVEVSQERQAYRCYFDEANFTAENERRLLAQVEGTDYPLIRLGCWPNGARSALAITGDIDALTLWDYGLRLVGR
jgi:peptidoglycan/xylan/chitin deacetylase (PgdA/CDA1 family)